MVASNYVPRRLGLCWFRAPGLLPVSAASPSMDHEHGTVCQPILERQIRLSAPSSVILRPTCFSSSLRCCWQVGSAPFVRRRCDCLASSAPFTNIQTYLLTYLLTYPKVQSLLTFELTYRAGKLPLRALHVAGVRCVSQIRQYLFCWCWKAAVGSRAADADRD